MNEEELEQELDQIKHPTEDEQAREREQIAREFQWNLRYLIGAVLIIIIAAVLVTFA